MRACRLDCRCSIVCAVVTMSATTLSVEQLAKAEVVIGLLTAHALDITIPESILLRADEVIR